MFNLQRCKGDFENIEMGCSCKKRETKLPQMPEMISRLSWRVIGAGDTGRMGFLSWSLHPFISNQVKRKTTFNSSPNQALCTSSNILGAHLSRQTPAQGREGLGGGQTTKTHTVHLECICCKYTLACSCKDHTRLDRNFLD